MIEFDRGVMMTSGTNCERRIKIDFKKNTVYFCPYTFNSKNKYSTATEAFSSLGIRRGCKMKHVNTATYQKKYVLPPGTNRSITVGTTFSMYSSKSHERSQAKPSGNKAPRIHHLRSRSK